MLDKKKKVTAVYDSGSNITVIKELKKISLGKQRIITYD